MSLASWQRARRLKVHDTHSYEQIASDYTCTCLKPCCWWAKQKARCRDHALSCVVVVLRWLLVARHQVDASIMLGFWSEGFCAANAHPVTPTNYLCIQTVATFNTWSRTITSLSSCNHHLSLLNLPRLDSLRPANTIQGGRIQMAIAIAPNTTPWIYTWSLLPIMVQGTPYA